MALERRIRELGGAADESVLISARLWLEWAREYVKSLDPLSGLEPSRVRPAWLSLETSIWRRKHSGLLDDRAHLLDYGRPGGFPPHALVKNPVGQLVPTVFLSALHAVPVEQLNAAAEYNPGEIVMWVDTADGTED
ncbi:hypothetical protein [Streptomyces sp. NPDC023327]|uniref:hypothetical protein n=1 Tax=Streptomyces sp. NPDC023327 TaxID=3157088 RepID=UPI0034093D77